MIKSHLQNLWRATPDDLDRSGWLRLDRNERTSLFPPQEFAALLAQLTPYDLIAYANLEPCYSAVAAWLRVAREEVLLAPGSDAAIKALFETYIEAGDEVVVSLPNYAMFSVYTQMFGGREVAWDYGPDRQLDLNRLPALCNERTRMVVISNPSHTGTALGLPYLRDWLRQLAERKILAVVDEAYYLFHPDTVVDWIQEFPNLVVVRTFSKAFGLASLRVGVLAACRERIQELSRVRLVHEVDGVAAKIVTYLLAHPGTVDRYVAAVEAGKKLLSRRMPATGCEVYASASNFIFLKPPVHPVERLVAALAERKIAVKGPFSHPSLAGCVRVTVGEPEQMAQFCDAVETLLGVQTFFVQ